MGYVIYDGNKIQPAPLVEIEKNYSRSDDGTIIGALYTLTMNGMFLPDKGSPLADGTFWTGSLYPPDTNPPTNPDSRLAVILKKQKAIMELFSEDNQGKLLEIFPADGSTPLSCNPNIISVNFEQDIWFNYCRYSIVLSTNELFPFNIVSEVFPEFLDSISDTWSIENDETPLNPTNLYTIKVSHNLSAKGKIRFDNVGGIERQAWEEARAWCIRNAGYNSGIVLDPSGLLRVSNTLLPYNHVRSENIDKYGGAYALTESWILSPSGVYGTATEDFNISIQSAYDNSISSVTVEGSVQGLEERATDMTIVKSKYQNASGYYNDIKNNIYSRAQSYSNL